MNLIDNTKKIIKKIPYVFELYKYYKYKNKIAEISKISKKHNSIINDYQQHSKTPLTIIYTVMHISVFKTDLIFKKMLKDSNFKPVILIVPYIFENENKMLNDMDDMYNYFKKLGFPVINAYNKEDKSWVDVKKDINPDMVFMSNPHNLTKHRYYKDIFSNYICYYVPYGYPTSNYGGYFDQYNQLFHNAMYKIFSSANSDLDICKKYSDNKGINVEVTGYPATEIYLDKKYKCKDVWKKQSKKKLRIIFAPHHTIAMPTFPLATFLQYGEYLQELVEIYKDTIQWAFKPHPLLKMKLKKHKDWGEKKTNEYWDFWKNQENTQLNESEYADLFMTSDAMIHDCSSFIGEYLFTNKPVLYLIPPKVNILNYFSPLGIECFGACAHGNKQEDIDIFIKSLIKGEDDMKEKREQFLEKNVYPYHKDKMPSDRIIESIKKDFGIL